MEDPNENFRVRKCVINYFLEDDTLYIHEPKIENSGIPQGVFLKRHQVPKPDGSGLYTWRDFDAGTEVEFYGRVFRICSYDEFTWRFYNEQG